jgi:hypothetical protein
MTYKYQGINKKKKVYVDKDGQLYGLGKQSFKEGEATVFTGSGTLLAAGHLTLSGSQYKPTSVVVASYNEASVGSGTLNIAMDDGTATFRGLASANFYYAVFN